MGNSATNIDEQISLLMARGMQFDAPYDGIKAKEILLDIGYYRLGFYWHSFENDEFHTFQKGVQFKDVLDLYYLDSDLREILLRAIKRIEVNFRTQLIYQVSNIYKMNPQWYLDPSILQESFVETFKRNFYTSKFISSNKAIKKHHEKYPDDQFAPAWKTLEYLTFGSIELLFKSIIDEEIKLLIAKWYGIYQLDIFNNYLKTIVFMRNICAHNEVLFDSNTIHGIKMTPLINITKDDRHSLFGSTQVILYILGRISNNRKRDIEGQMRVLFDKFKHRVLIQNIIENKMRFNYSK